MQTQSTSGSRIRREKFKLLAEGYERISIRYLADAVGVSLTTAIGEIGQMAAEGEFGMAAYVDYATQELVLKEGSPRQTDPRQQARAAADQAREAFRQARTAAGSAAASFSKAAGAAAASFSQAAEQAASSFEKTAQSWQKPQTQKTSKPAPKTSAAADMKKAEKPKKVKQKRYVPMLLTGLAVTAGGVLCLAASLDHIAMAGFLGWLITGGSLSAAGGGLLTARSGLRRRDNRRAKYQAYMVGRNSAKIPLLAETAGVSAGKARRELEQMTADGLFGETAYVDSGADALILKPAEAPEETEKTKYAYDIILKQLRKLDEEIADEKVSELTRSIEDTCGKIFRAVQDDPEKESQLRTFTGYYLPTALKLLRSYATLEKQGQGGENINAARQSILRSLSTLDEAFRLQLDKLYSGEVMDAESDEDVLDTMLHRDGLDGKK